MSIQDVKGAGPTLRMCAVMATVFLVAVACTDQSSGPSARATGDVTLSSDKPVAIVEFEGSLVVAPVANDEMGALFSRFRPRGDSELERANVERFVEEVLIDGTWQSWPPGEQILLSLNQGSNTVRYRWTFELADGASEVTVPLEARLSPLFLPAGGVSGPQEDEVPTVTLQIASVMYP